MSAPATVTDNRVLRRQVGTAHHLMPLAPSPDGRLPQLLAGEIADCIAAQNLHIVLDLNHIPSVNSALIETLLDCSDQLAHAGGSLKLINVSLVNRETFWITDVESFIPVYDKDGKLHTPAPLNRPQRGKFLLGEMLVSHGAATAEQVELAMAQQQKTGRRLGRILIEQFGIAEAVLLKLLGEQLGVPYIRLRPGLFDTEIAGILDQEVQQRMNVLPLFRVRDKLVLATTDPQDISLLDEVRQSTGLEVRPVLASGVEIQKIRTEGRESDYDLGEFVNELEDDLELIDNTIPDDYSIIDEIASGSPVINLVNAVIQRAIRDGVSDIHIEPSKAKSRIRFRIDGILYEFMTPARDLHPSILSRLKIMSNLDISERRLPQDGRIQVNTQGRMVDLRFSSLPGIYGEKAVLRVLDKNHSILDLHKLGLREGNLKLMKKLLAYSHGLVLAVGPTGSGKTTTLYACINHLNSIERNIVTIEDPVEYHLDIINQNQVNDRIGLGFARMLRHILRQDPDVIMVGEIRDRETAEIGVQSALTGHLVLSTLHTNESTETITRLLEMGIEPYLLSSALIGVIAQRLVRTICANCQTSFVAPPGLLQQYGWDDKSNLRLMKGRGCPGCYDSGYKGRIAIHEILQNDAELQKLMLGSSSTDELGSYLKNRGIPTMFDDGLQRVLEGKTTIDELTRVIEYI